MATKSFLKNVDIKEKYSGRTLVEALEKATRYKKNKPVTRILCNEVPKNKLKDIFG